MRHRALHRKAQEHVAILQRVGQRARLGFHRMRALPLVHAFGAAAIDHALGIAQDRVRVRQAHRLQQFEAGDAGRARAVHHHLDVFDLAARQMQRIDDAGGGDDGGAVLVVVEDRECPSTRASASSITKQSGALMSSRLMPPKVGPR